MPDTPPTGSYPSPPGASSSPSSSSSPPVGVSPPRAERRSWLGRLGERLSPTRMLGEVLQKHAPSAADSILNKARVEADAFTDRKISQIRQEMIMFVEEIEKKLDERIAKELEWKLKGLKLTLLFLVIMTLISLCYVIVKHFIEGERQEHAPATLKEESAPVKGQ